MADTEDDGFNEEAFKGFGDDPAPVAPPVADNATPPAEPPKPAEEPKKDEQPAPVAPSVEPPKEDVTVTPGTEKKPEEGVEPPKASEPPPTSQEPPQPLTRDDVKSVVSDLLNGERSSSKELENTTKEVLDAYYPDGLSNVLEDENGRKLQTPADVVEASGNKMTTEEAAQWLMNEQYKLDTQVNKIKEDARAIAETTVNFKRDAISAVAKYEPLFKKYPVLQQKVWDKLMKQVKVDKDKGVITSAPDVMEHYDDYLEPYQQAYEFSTQQPATNPTPPPTPEPPKPTAEDRMDEGGDGGITAPNDPNDFAQQVSKELAKGI